MSLDAEATTDEVYNYAIKLLSRREYSVQELLQKFATKFSDSAGCFEDVLERLQRQHYQSDRRFAEAYIRHRSSKGFGPERILLELGQRGVHADDIAIGFTDSGLSEEDWQAVLQTVWQKKFAEPPTDWPDRAKQIKFLRYRGFSTEQVDTFLSSLP